MFIQIGIDLSPISKNYRRNKFYLYLNWYLTNISECPLPANISGIFRQCENCDCLNSKVKGEEYLTKIYIFLVLHIIYLLITYVSVGGVLYIINIVTVYIVLNIQLKYTILFLQAVSRIQSCTL